MKNKFFYFAILPALLFQLIGASLYFNIFSGQDFSQYIYFGTKVLLVIWPLIFLSQIKSFDWSFFKGNVKKSLQTGLASGLAIVAFVTVTYFLFENFWIQFAPQVREAASGLNVLDHYILFALFLSIIHSFIEEYYWRWFVLNGLMIKFKKWSAIILASLAFTSHHFIVVLKFSNLWLASLASVGIFLLAMFWSYLYFKTKSLSGAWLSHFFADVAIMTIGYLMIFG